jgi:hypothetical protein
MTKPITRPNLLKKPILVRGILFESLGEAADFHEINRNRFRNRLYLGWSVEEALELKPRKFIVIGFRKRCPKCNEVKLLEEFSNSMCKNCRNNKWKQRYHNDPEYRNVISFNRWKSKAKTPRVNIGNILNNIKRRYKGNINLNIDYLLNLFYSQDGKCALSGIVMTWGAGKGKSPTSISLDRVIPELGYITGNIRFVCDAINTFRGRMSDKELFDMAEALVSNMKQNGVGHGSLSA